MLLEVDGRRVSKQGVEKETKCNEELTLERPQGGSPKHPGGPVFNSCWQHPCPFPELKEKSGHSGGSRTSRMSLGCRLQESWDDRSSSPNSLLLPGTRCPSSYRPGGLQSHPVGRRDTWVNTQGPYRQERGAEAVVWGPHLAGVPALTPRTQHVLLDKLVDTVVLLST